MQREKQWGEKKLKKRERLHSEFILSPITVLMQNAVYAVDLFGTGIGTYPAVEYVVKSLFLEMTGFLEQKCKCICWEIASDDYEFRYKWLSRENSKCGEYSTYDSKNYIYSVLQNHLKTSFDFLDSKKLKMVEGSQTDVIGIFEKSPVPYFAEKDYLDLKFKKLTEIDVLDLCCDEKGNNEDKNFFLFRKNGPFFNEYEKLYCHRNRCAHNTVAYQKNLPDFDSICDGKFEINYFTWFYILNVIDKVYIELFKKYEEQN